MAVVVAVNVFATDSAAEIELVKAKALEAGATAAVESNHWALGGKGAVDLGHAIVESCGKMRAQGSPFKFLYPLDIGIAEKFEIIASTSPPPSFISALVIGPPVHGVALVHLMLTVVLCHLCS